MNTPRRVLLDSGLLLRITVNSFPLILNLLKGERKLGRVHIKISRDVRRIWKTRADGTSAPIKRLVLYLKIRNVNTP